jgi:hypothetical protein
MALTIETSGSIAEKSEYFSTKFDDFFLSVPCKIPFI